MSAFVNNPFALLSDDADVQAAAVPKKPALPEAKPATKPATVAKKPQERDGRPAGTPRGRGGRASAPRPPRESNTDDFTGGHGAPSDRPHQAPRGDRAPRGGHRGEGRPPRREFDRRSATGRHDGEKKQVAGASWGGAIEATGVTEGQSSEQALAVTEQSTDDWNAGSSPVGDAVPVATDTKVIDEQDKTMSYAEYEKEHATKKAALKAKPARKANEGVEDASLKTSQVLSKKDINEEAGSLAMLLAGNKQKKKVERKQPKDRQVVTDLLKFQFTADYPRRPERSDRSDRSERPSHGGFRGDRPPRTGANSASFRGSNKLMSVNINDTMAFPSLA